MDPVYDLRTEGGKEALNQRLLGFGPGGMADSFLGSDIPTKALAPNTSYVVSENVAEAFNYIRANLQGASENSPLDESVANAPWREPIGKILSYFKWIKFGDPEGDGFYVPLCDLDDARIQSTDDRAWSLIMPSFLVDFSSEDSSTVQIDFASDVYNSTVQTGQIIFRDSNDNVISGSECSDYPVYCTAIGRFCFAVLSTYAETFQSGDGGFQDFQPFGVILDPGNKADIVSMMSFDFGNIMGVHFAPEYSSAFGLPPSIGCPTDLTSVFKLDPNGEAGFDSPESIDNMKDEFSDYDWDHPITGNGEDIGLSATKKHFIRIS